MPDFPSWAVALVILINIMVLIKNRNLNRIHQFSLIIPRFVLMLGYWLITFYPIDIPVWRLIVRNSICLVFLTDAFASYLSRQERKYG
jgi:hypothetical protein